MEWSEKQQHALDQVSSWLEGLNSPDKGDWSQVFRLFGYAGTGKTTLAKHFSEGVNGTTLFAAFTGKAALILQEKGCSNASTIHRLIYRPKSKSAALLHDLQSELAVCNDLDLQRELRSLIDRENLNLKRPSFSLNTESDIRSAALVIIDEVSMVGWDMGEDLVSFGVPILVLGDTAQLPPVASGGYFTDAMPNMMLTEIHRQAEGSPIIQLATSVREGRGLQVGEFESDDHPSSFVVPKGVLTIKQMSEFDQILCGRNATRKVINRQLREEVRGSKTHLPEEGDKLVCLRNNHDLGLLNGSLWDVVSCEIEDEDEIGLLLKDPVWGKEVATLAHRHYFEDRESDLGHWEMRDRDAFDFGYALTVHKSQGSQWKKVVVVDESSCFRNDRLKWLYTGITRASETITIVR